MKIHRHLVQSLVDILASVFRGGQHADRAIEFAFKSNPKWGAKDRRFIAETTYGCVRWWGKLWYIVGKDISIQGPILWQVVGVYLLTEAQYTDLPKWEEWKALDKTVVKNRYEEARKTRFVNESIPEWLDHLGYQELSEDWPLVLNLLNQQAPVFIRVNSLKAHRATVMQQLAKLGIEARPAEEAPDCLMLIKRANVFQTPLFKNGLFEVQDLGSQMIAPYLEPGPGMLIVDACAGAGGKTLHLAALTKNKGRIIAMDIRANKLEELKRRARRNSVSNVEVRLIQSSKVIKRLYSKVDRLLLDVPCSGLGILRRNPDSKWKLSLNRIEELKGIQKQILHDYSQMVKPGGKMVYATCSILPSENEQQVAQFLETDLGKKWKLVKEQQLFPKNNSHDGFYFAQLERKFV